MTTAFVTHHDCSRHDTGWGHPEHQGRLPAVARAVYREMLTFHAVLREVEGVPLTDEDLQLAHTPAYLQRVRKAVGEAAAAGEPLAWENGTVLSGASWDAVTAAAGCAVTAADLVLDGGADNAFCAVRPPGSGAGRESAGNHAIVNNVAIAARHLRHRRGLDSVLIVEIGEWFGHGTAEIAAMDPGLHYLGAYAGGNSRPAAPDRVIPIGLEAGAGVSELLEGLRAGAATLIARSRPRMILLSLGLDVLGSDAHGRLAVEPTDLHVLTRWAVDVAVDACDGRLVSVLEGGYDPPALGQAVVHHLRALAGVPE